VVRSDHRVWWSWRSFFAAFLVELLDFFDFSATAEAIRIMKNSGSFQLIFFGDALACLLRQGPGISNVSISSPVDKS